MSGKRLTTGAGEWMLVSEHEAIIAATPDRDSWPGPRELRGASGRDAFLWYICDAWPKLFGGNERIETVLDHDFGMHVLRRGMWQLTFANLEEFPDAEFPRQEKTG